MWYSPKNLEFSTDGFYTTCGCAVFAVRVWSFVLQWMMMMMVIMIILIMLKIIIIILSNNKNNIDSNKIRVV